MIFPFSAAKAPYLAKFKVRHCGINKLEKLAAAGGEIQEEETDTQVELSDSVYWQACIFKVGDDVRQVRSMNSLTLIFLTFLAIHTKS